MPNWNHNRVYFVCDSEEEADEVIARLSGVDTEGKKQEFTFNAFIPMPKELDITCGSETNRGMSFLKQYPDGIVPEGHEADRPSDEAIELGRKALENVRKFGYPTWYEWRRAYWGTKWDASDVVVNRGDATRIELSFTNAWGMPVGVAMEMKEVFGEKLFAWLYSGEDDWRQPAIFSEQRELDIFAEDMLHREWHEFDFELGIEDDGDDSSTRILPGDAKMLLGMLEDARGAVGRDVVHGLVNDDTAEDITDNILTTVETRVLCRWLGRFLPGHYSGQHPDSGDGYADEDEHILAMYEKCGFARRGCYRS